MAGTSNHYELAFAGWLNRHAIRAMSIAESRRPVCDGRHLKKFDFLVDSGPHVWGIDLQGRKGTPWITRDDLFSMMGWQGLLEGKIQPAFVFAFLGDSMKGLAATHFETPAGIYRFCLLSLNSAQRLANPRSERWRTLGFSARAFIREAIPLAEALALELPERPSLAVAPFQ